MTASDYITDAFANLIRRKVRMTLASLGVAVGTVTIVLLVSLALGVRQQINRQFQSIGLNQITALPAESRHGFDRADPPERTRFITPAKIDLWKSLPGVAKVTPRINLPGSVNLKVRWQTNTQSVRMAASMAQPGAGPGWLGTSAPLAGTLELPEQGGIILSRGTIQGLNLGSNEWSQIVGKTIEAFLRTPRGETQSFSFRITGISAERVATIQASPLDCLAMKSWWFNTTNLLQTEGYDSAEILATDATQAKSLVPRLRSEGFQVQSLDMFLEIANRIIVAITVVLALIGSVGLFVAAIGIVNTMVMAVYERTREIGILKALGASRADIRRLFMIEAGLIGLAGGATGLGLGWGIGLGLNQVLDWFLKYRDIPLNGSFFVVTPALAAGVVVFAAGIGVLAGLVPAHRAATLDPLIALRHE